MGFATADGVFILDADWEITVESVLGDLGILYKNHLKEF